MKDNKFLPGLCILALTMAGCSNDEINNDPNNPNDDVSGEKAYLSVNITDAATLSRASSDDNAFEYGSEKEQDVASADFYFYDADGVFVTQASVWDGGDANKNEPVENIEYFGKSVVVLKGLKRNNFPKYLVTVLNAPEGFKHGATLKEMETALSYLSSPSEDGGYLNEDKFIMSTTSFVPAANYSGTDVLPTYFTTEVSESDFKKEPAETESATPIDIYVERLAAKVTLGVDAKDGEEGYLLSPVKNANGDTYYKMQVTIAGEDNAAEDDSNIAAEDIYVKFLGWGLNATAKESDIVKNIKTDLTNTGWENMANGNLGFVWNIPDYHRSYWGMSYNYGKEGTYPEDHTGADACKYLNYISANDLTATFTQSLYCAENTNSSEIISVNFPSAVTSILLKARICSDTNGTALYLIRYNGLLYTPKAYMAYVLNSLKNSGKLNAWYKSSDDGSYHQIDENYVALDNDGDGKVVLELNPSATLYEKGTNDQFSEMNESDLSSFNAKLAAFNSSNEAMAYKDGLMYYNIPVEHLNNSAKTTTEDGSVVIPEAKYGIVRNHHYVVTITSLSGLGTGIYDPDEKIVPSGDDDNQSYYVGARINILSWKIVNQNVIL